MMMRRESQSPTVAGVFTELCFAAGGGAATGADAACCAALLAAANGSISCLSHGP